MSRILSINAGGDSKCNENPKIVSGKESMGRLLRAPPGEKLPTLSKSMLR